MYYIQTDCIPERRNGEMFLVLTLVYKTIHLSILYIETKMPFVIQGDNLGFVSFESYHFWLQMFMFSV